MARICIFVDSVHVCVKCHGMDGGFAAGLLVALPPCVLSALCPANIVCQGWKEMLYIQAGENKYHFLKIKYCITCHMVTIKSTWARVEKEILCYLVCLWDFWTFLFWNNGLPFHITYLFLQHPFNFKSVLLCDMKKWVGNLLMSLHEPRLLLSS